MNTRSNIIHNSQTVKPIQMSTNWWINMQYGYTIIQQQKVKQRHNAIWVNFENTVLNL